MLKFSPNGTLDVGTDPSSLPESLSGKDTYSGHMIRCTNIDLSRPGMGSTRPGSSKYNGVAINTDVHHITVQAGVRYTFSGANIYNDESSIASGLTDAKWSSILYNSYSSTVQNVFALNGTDRKRIEGSNVYEWGLAAPSAAPTVAGQVDYIYTFDLEADYLSGSLRQFGQEYDSTSIYTFDFEAEILGGASVSGDSETQRAMFYFEDSGSETDRIGVKYTYVRKSGTTVISESNPSDAAYTEIDGGIYVTWAASSDSDVTHVRFYRTTASGSTFYYSDEFAVLDLAGVLKTTDASLGSEVSTNHNRPPLGTIVLGPDMNGVCFILKDNLLYWCLAKQPEYWPTANYVEISSPDDPCVGGTFHGGRLYVFTKSGIYEIQGAGTNSFFPIRLATNIGALSQEGVLSVKGAGLFRAHRDGLWLWNGTRDELVTDPQFSPIFDGTTKGSMPGASSSNMNTAILRFFKNRVWFGYPSSNYPDNWIVYDIVKQKAYHYDYSQNFRTMAIDMENGDLIAGDDSGFLWKLESGTDDAGTAISWQAESKEFTNQVRAYFPRKAKYDVDVNGGTAVGNIVLDGTIHAAHTITGSRNTVQRLIPTGNGKRLSIRITGTGPVDIYAAEVE